MLFRELRVGLEDVQNFESYFLSHCLSLENF